MPHTTQSNPSPSMADMAAQLSSELTRIIDCCYPASLSHLADLLARADNFTIRVCIQDRSPCAVSRLATLIHEALPLWPHALRILSSLCYSPEFVDILLRQNPGLLDALFNKANSSPHEYDEYAELCVLLLSRPLPASVPLPASTQPFFLRVFEQARQDPDVNTLKAVYSMLNGACRNLLGLLSTHRREQFDQVLSHILSSTSTGQKSMLMLWCFGIALLAEPWSETTVTRNPRLDVERTAVTSKTQWKTASGHKMFGSLDRIHKTISLTYLSVIFAIKDDEHVSDEDAVEGIRIAIRTLQCVDRTALKEWPKSSPLAKGTFTKLPLKILRTNINPAVQFEAMCFYALVAGEGNLPADIVTQYERCLTNVAHVVHSDRLGETFLLSLPIYIPQMQQSSVQTLLAGIFDACTSPSNTRQMSAHTVLAEKITTLIPNSESLRDKVLEAVSSSEMLSKVWELIRFETVEVDVTCQAYATALHSQLISASIALLLTLALAVQPTGHTLSLAITTALISKQTQITRRPRGCFHELPTTQRSTVSLFQQKNTPYTGQHLQDWRDRLKSELEGQGSYQRDSVIRSVALICQDLETRCNTVEEPLRREKEKSKELEHCVDELNQRIASLEVQVTDDQFYSDGLEEEKLMISNERDSLSKKLQKLQVESDEAIRRADGMLVQLREDFNAKELEFRSAELTHQETIRSLQNDTEAQRREMEDFRLDLVNTQHECTSLIEQLKSSQHQLGAAENKLACEIEVVRTQFQEITQLKERNAELDLQLQGVEVDLDTVAARLSELQVNHRELVQSSEDAYNALEQKYTRDMETATAQAQKDHEELDAKLQDAVQHGQSTSDVLDETRKELGKLQTSLPPLEERIQELTEFCSEQEEELEELRTLRKNVLASMGLATQNPLAIRSASRSQRDATDLHTPRVTREHRRRKSTLQATAEGVKSSRALQGATSTAMETVANASFASSDSQSSQNGSTPKRPKHCPSFKVPAMQTPYTQKPILVSRSISKKLSPIKRSALRQLSPNRRHTTVGFASSQNEQERPDKLRSLRKRRGSLQEHEEEDFDMEDFLAGSPLTPGNFATGTGRLPDDTDVTTTEL
ncbi:hypothetical protein BDU57DRAFT_502327 [Ampelomyces quisqualis]|uniref:Uncharacterized protein n=1 Tax=Ampelomyces quisqualis TaxID=50730 RepID=A0A6A5QE47_AMPQU|nr:hypothetical protein BDU57DRAFT_502327 [Ampelomyces quisqualis]